MTGTLSRQGGAAAVDWAGSMLPRDHAAVVAGWVVSAAAVAGMLSLAAVLALWLDQRAGDRNALEQAMLIDLPPLPPPPALTAAAEAAPDAPMVDAPDAPVPAAPAEAAPDAPEAAAAPAALPPPDLLQLAQTPDLPQDSLAPPPPPPPEPAADPAPEPVPRTRPRPKPQKTVTPPAPPAPSVASTKTAASAQVAGQGEVAVSTGRAKDLKASWGAAIRKRVERRKAYPAAAGNAQGTTTVRLRVTRGGALAEVSVSGSSGDAALDQAAIRAVRSAGRFPAAPKGLGDASYVYTLPISFSR